MIHRVTHPDPDGVVYALMFRSTTIAEATVYPKGYVTAVRVEERFRRRGYGRMLMEWIQEDFDRLCLGVMDGNDAAVALYEQVGFVANDAGSCPGITEMVWERPEPTFVERFAHQVSMGIGSTLLAATKGYAATMLDLEDRKNQIRMICPERADYYIEAARDRVRMGHDVDTMSALEATADWLASYGCMVEIPAHPIGSRMAYELVQTGASLWRPGVDDPAEF